MCSTKNHSHHLKLKVDEIILILLKASLGNILTEGTFQIFE